MSGVASGRLCRVLLGGLLGTVLLSLLAATSATAATNPSWAARCPQRFVLVLDLSSSMTPNLDQVKQSASDLVDALSGAPNQVGVVVFGDVASVAIPMADVGNDGQRHQIKSAIEDVGLTLVDTGGTNWEAGLITAASLRPDAVLLLTDGEPSEHGIPGKGRGIVSDNDNLGAAVRAADRLRAGGTRIVGVGIGLNDVSAPNLIQVTGPRANDDYYQTGSDASGLLSQLYDVASKSCGIPVAALPKPETAPFPFLPAIGGVVAAALLAVVIGLFRNRPKKDKVRPGLDSGPPARRRDVLKAPSISMDEVAHPSSDIAAVDEPARPDPSASPPRVPRRLRADRVRRMEGSGPEHSP